MKMNKKYKVIALIALIVLMLGTTFAFAGNGKLVNIFIDGKRITSDVEPTIVNGRTMVPLKFIAENFDAEVEWDATTRSVIITKNGVENEVGESGDPSSPVLQLSESWKGIVNGIEVDMAYDQSTQRFYGTVRNASNNVINNILIELNLKLGTRTVVELGPKPVGNLNPGEMTTVELFVKDEPEAVGITFNAWEIHPEAEGKGEGSNEGAGEAHGNEGAESGEEGSSTGSLTLNKNQTYDMTKNGGHLVLVYNAKTQSFEGRLKNVGSTTLTRARVEIHLDNGVELGPTVPVDLKPGETKSIVLKSSGTFNTWTTHAEFGAGESGEGSESSEGSESGEGGESHGNEGGRN